MSGIVNNYLQFMELHTSTADSSLVNIEQLIEWNNTFAPIKLKISKPEESYQ